MHDLYFQNVDPEGCPAPGVFKSSSMALLQARDDTTNINASYLEGAKKVVLFMRQLWESEKLCDVELDCMGGERLFSHQIALGAYSDQLAHHFMKNNTREKVRINLQEYPKEVVHTILMFVYTTELQLSSTNIGQILGCAMQLGMSFIVKHCLQYLRYAINYFLGLLVHTIRNYVLKLAPC